MAQLNKDLQKAADRVDAFDAQVKSLTTDELAKAPILEVEPQTKLSQREIEKQDGVYLKPDRTINSKEPFNEKYRSDYEFEKEYVPFIAEHKELIGETIEIWTKRFAGTSAEFWKVPTNKKVWGPRYLAEQISRKSYTRLIMEDRSTGTEGGHTFYGQLAAANRIQRLDAKPAKNISKSSFSSQF